MVTERELEQYRGQLLALGNRIKGDMKELSGEALRKDGGEASGSLSNTPLHLADLGTDAFEHEMTLGLLENERQVLQQVAQALERMEKGAYGRCERCGAEITQERLRAIPYTSYCIGCAQQVQATMPPPGTTGA
jgi:DnaK suppressor protein